MPAANYSAMGKTRNYGQRPKILNPSFRLDVWRDHKAFIGRWSSRRTGRGRGDAWRSLLTDELGKSVAQSGGVGVASQVYSELIRLQAK